MVPLSSVSLLPARSRCARRSVPDGRGFTLLEVLLTLSIIGLIASVLVGGAARLMDDRPVSAGDLFWQAVQEARATALKSECEVGLRFVDDREKGKSFVVAGEGGVLRQFPIPAAGDLEVTFLVPQKGGSLIMIAGTVLETQKIAAVTFYPDGTCSAFRAQFFRNGASHIVAIDPWTCAPVLTSSDAAGAPRI